MNEIDKIIEEVTAEHPYKERGNRDSYSQYNEGWSDACDILGERIRQALSLYSVSHCPLCNSENLHQYKLHHIHCKDCKENFDKSCD